MIRDVTYGGKFLIPCQTSALLCLPIKIVTPVNPHVPVGSPIQDATGSRLRLYFSHRLLLLFEIINEVVMDKKESGYRG